ncbi:hypothetical protein BSKO_12982 [Bryopsis sp. KO-2023]|nr:hypothetical protein BSKO_12982 [Bryopsis sp. KO-2023]
MEVGRLVDAFQSALDRAQDSKHGSTVAIVSSGVVLLAGAYVLTRRSKSKSKPGTLDLIKEPYGANGQVKGAFDGYSDAYSAEAGESVVEKDRAPELADTFYNLVTDFYEWGWGQSFHFSPPLPGKGWYAAEVAHETRIAGLLGLKPGMKCLDAGCGVGGPMRTISCASGAEVTGVTINQYQVDRANYHNNRMGIELCKLVKSNFLKMPFEDNTFDAAYAIEATCHAPTLEEVYGEIYRVMKPGSTFVSYEWLTTPSFDPTNTAHVKLIDAINYGNGLPDMRTLPQALEAAKKCGFELVNEWDLAINSGSGNWYDRLANIKAHANVVNRFLVNLFSFLRLLPAGVRQVHDMLLDAAAEGLVSSGELNIFTPMHCIVLRKPKN